MFRYEWKRMKRERGFRAILWLLLALCALSAGMAILRFGVMKFRWSKMPVNEYGALYQNPNLSVYSLFNHWLGGSPNGIAALLYYNLLPLCAAIPYAASVFEDKRTGYIRSLVSQYGRKKYFLCRYWMTFFSGAVVIVLPLLVNYLTVACFVPARMPDSTMDIYYQVYWDTLFGKLFYLHPLLYDFLYLMLDGIFAGIWATVPLACSLYFKSKLSVYIVPFIALAFLSFAAEQALAYRVWLTVAPVNLIRPISSGNFESGWVLFAEILVLFAASFIAVMWKGCRDDLY